MRIDKFLKVSRLVKRRTVAKEMADQGRIKVNGVSLSQVMMLKLMTLLKLATVLELLKPRF